MPPILHIDKYSLDLQNVADHIPILKEIDFHISPQEIVGLVGDSGCGKSMTLKAILGLVSGIKGHSSSGHIWFKGQDINTTENINKIRNQEIGLVFQQSSQVFNPTQRIGYQLQEKLELLSLINGSKEVILNLLEEVELSPPDLFYNKYPYQLSGGQVQRCLIALALINDPQLLLADEPLSALDNITQQEILGLLSKLNERRSLAILLVSHDRELVTSFCDRIVFMEKGQIVVLDDEAISSSLQLHQFAQPQPQPQPQPKLPNPNQPFLAIHQLQKSFKKVNVFKKSSHRNRVLANFDLSIDKGEILGLYGPSGSGKSTLARIIARLDSPDNGTIYFNGQDITLFNSKGLNRYRKKCQIIFQDPLSSMPPHRTMSALLEDVFWVLGKADAQEEVYSLLEQMGLDRGLLGRLPHQLSGGQRQRFMIMRALLIGAEFLICDEILASLDKSVSIRILELLKSLVQSRNLTILFISHDENLLSQLCDRVIEMPVVEEKGV